jgi:light-regulated signal transduction histidine kinase (bacteriophytochrome)
VGFQGSLSEALLRCEDEPIRVPGSVQQHGFFLLVDSSFERVLVASANTERFLNLPLKLILGSSLDALLGRELNLALGSLRSQPPNELPSGVMYLGAFRLGDNQFSVMMHSIGSGNGVVNRALEFEQKDRLVGPELMNSVITNFVASLERLENEQDLCEALSEKIAELTGFDRVMLYSFNAEGHGTVLSEINNGRLPRYLGLRFPASDIPKQARELYVVNTTRIIPDASYEPSPLVGASTGQAVQLGQLDLSLSVLRSVSPIHLQYMKNMGTVASMSVSIVLSGKLWGLVSCHATEAKTVPYLIRSACDMLTKMAVTRLSAFQADSRLRELMHFHSAQRALLTILASEQNYLAALTRQCSRLMTIANASGAAVLVDGKYFSAGLVPDDATLERLSGWLDEDEDREIFASSHLESVLPWTESIRDVASGLIAVRISSVRRRYVLWFRPEVVSTVEWAGEPVKQMAVDTRLTPRASFHQWKEIVHGRSEPWMLTEIESAADFRSALITVGLHRAEEAIELGEARFQQLTQALPVKIFATDASGRLTYVNERWLESGLAPAGLWFEQALLRTEDAEMSAALWHECVTTGKNFEAEVRLLVGDSGAERWNYARVVPFQRAGAMRAGWIGTFVDLTESRERELAMRMTEKLALTGRMTSVIAHEINNPLEAITNLMYLLRGEAQSDTAVGFIDQIEGELDRISGVTKQTLRWNRETGRPESFEIHDLVDEVLRLFAGKIRNKQIAVQLVDESLVVGWGIVGQIRQILANLVLNAIDAAPIDGRIVVRVLEHEAETGFSVEDDGSGMTKAMQSRLFEPFFSTKGDLGNGLGLYISHEIIVRHKGRIEVHSDEGKGTTMTVWFPRGEKMTDALLA